MTAPQSIVGARIRERRRALGISQADLARRVGISASYLNLIERNRRGIAGKRLGDIARALGLRAADLDGAAERRLHEALSTIAEDPRLDGLGIEAEAVSELLGRYPGWARAIGALARAEQETAEKLRIVSDRLTHDPFLGETVHRINTRIAAIRSTSEILETFSDIAPDQAARFHAILAEESRALSTVAETLAAYFDRTAAAARRVTPVDEVEAFFEERGHRFPALEEALATTPNEREDRRARAEAELRAGPVIDRLIAEATALETAPARDRARGALLAYAIDAVRAPLVPFAATARETRYDIERIGHLLELPQDLVCRRLTTLPPGQGHPSFGHVAANAAGAILELRGIPGFHPVRYAPLCPILVLARAIAAPDRTHRQLAALPTGKRFVLVARARSESAPGFDRPRHYKTDLLAVAEFDAPETVYGAGLDALPVEEAGITCRLCARKACPERVEDPLGG